MISTARSLMLRRCLTRICKDPIKVYKSERKRKIRKGDVVNLTDLLFAKNRDYLIKYNDNQRVKADDLAGKVIVLYFLSLASGYSWDKQTAVLVDIYNELLPQACLEVVFVAVRDAIPSSHPLRSRDRTLQSFEQKFSTMPWTAVPFSDLKSRKSLEIRFGISSSADGLPPSFVIDPMGVVLQCDALTYFSNYGAAGYPFSDERIEFLISEDDAAHEQPSMKALLASAQRDYVINNKGAEVPVQDLEDKVVALYFYEDCLTDDFTIEQKVDLTIKLKEVYEQLAKNMEKFEVVLIYIHDSWDTYGCTNEETFWESFKTMPWLALPFKDGNIKKLVRVFEFTEHFEEPETDPRLVIVGPRGSFIERYGVDILMNFGCPAYPFTRERAAKLEAENIKKLKLDMLWEPNTIFRKKDGSSVGFSQLAGKRVILVFEDEVIRFPKFLKMLRARYLQTKYTDDGFEVIHIYSGQQRGFSIPWLTHPPFDYISDAQKLVNRVFPFDCGLLAFDCDGRIVRRCAVPTFEREDMDFPFYTGDLEKDSLMELKLRFNWEDESSDEEFSDNEEYSKVEQRLNI